MCIYQKIDPTAPGVLLRFHLVSADIAAAIRDVTVDGVTQVSDHQPVILTLA